MNSSTNHEAKKVSYRLRRDRKATGDHQIPKEVPGVLFYFRAKPISLEVYSKSIKSHRKLNSARRKVLSSAEVFVGMIL